MTGQFFDTVAEAYDEGFGFFAHFGRELARFAGVDETARLVLDLACGQGAVGTAAHALSGKKARVIGLDSSAGMLRAIAAAPIVPIRAAATRLPLHSGVFDVVLCGSALHIIPDAGVVLAEVHWVLRPGGTLAYSVPGPANDGGRWEWYANLAEQFEPYADPALLLTGPARPLDELVVEAGFTSVEHGHAEIHLPLANAETFWAWHQSHGARALVDAPTARHTRRTSFAAGSGGR